MKYLYIGTVCNFTDYEKMIRNFHVKPSLASLVFETALLSGLKQNEADITVYTFPMIPAFPGSPKLYWRSKSEKLECGYRNQWLGAINLKGLKQYSQKITSRKAIKKWFEENCDEKKAVFMYSVYEPIAINIIRYCEKYGAKCYAIIPDLPRDMYSNKKIGRIQKLATSLYLKKALAIQGKFDGYIYLTEAMKEVVNPCAPYIVIEGISCISAFGACLPKVEEKVSPPAIMYAGALNEKYGIKNLIEAFLQLENEAQLWLYGTGDFEGSIKMYAKQYPSIKFFGRRPYEEIVECERRATLLVNVRSPQESFTQYSFPSKIIEYMASGTPLLTTRLEGIPKEYFNYCFSIEDNEMTTIHEELKRILSISPEDLFSVGTKAASFIQNTKNCYKQAEKILDFMENN